VTCIVKKHWIGDYQMNQNQTLARGIVLFPLLLILFFSAGCSTPPPPPNLSILKGKIKDYYADGAYEKGSKRVGRDAMKGLKAWRGKKKTAIVLDIDDTSLSSYKHILATDFGYVPAIWNEWAEKAEAPAIQPVLALAKQAVAQDTAIFFITGRHEELRACTEKNLRNAGYPRWTSLIMKPDDDHRSADAYKRSERKKIVNMGYTIVINVGDQQSDLSGGYSEDVYKMPNPCYFIP